MIHRRTLMIAPSFCSLSGLASAQDAAPIRVWGTIVAVDAKSIQMTSRTGENLTFAIAPDVGVTAVVARKITDSKPNSYIGTAAMPQTDGTLLAREIQVFHENMRGMLTPDAM